MDSSAPYISANVGRFRGFADHYDAFRPQPPVMLVTILTQLAEVPYPTLVVDLGSGTGLSTILRYAFLSLCAVFCTSLPQAKATLSC
ncbi:MAG TPA: hypothetical protein PKK78_19615 [Kouleothrix sp.]|nr:hypothetical protein [Kouleothrix sp.]